MSRAPRVLLIALDACDISIVRTMVDQGDLPAFRDLLIEASTHEVINPPGVFEGSLWASFLTSDDVMKHGYWNWEEIAPGTYDHRETNVGDVQGEPFWVQLDAAGESVAIIDVPHSRPYALSNGIQLCEWGAHDLHLGLSSVPPSLVQDVLTRIGEYPVQGQRPDGGVQVAPDDYAHRSGPARSAAELARLRDDIVAGVRKKTELSLHYLDQRHWDLFLTVFGESHMVGHQCWHLHDPDYVLFDADLRAAVGDPVRDTYQALDESLGQLRARADASTTTFVFLSHGMGPHHDGKYLLAPVLARLDSGPPGHLTFLGRAAKKTWAHAPNMLRRGMRRLLVPVLAWRYPGRAVASSPEVPLEERRWFQTPNNYSVGGVRFNVVGRERQGRVHPGTELKAAYRTVTAGLLALVNADTGTPVVTSVARCDDLYDRSGVDSLPDLFVEWNLEHRIETVWSPDVGLVRVPDPEWRTGEHTSANGVLLTTGPDVPAGAQLTPLRIEDIGPTIADRLGVSMTDVSGRTVRFESGPSA